MSRAITNFVGPQHQNLQGITIKATLNPNALKCEDKCGKQEKYKGTKRNKQD